MIWVVNSGSSFDRYKSKAEALAAAAPTANVFRVGRTGMWTLVRSGDGREAKRDQLLQELADAASRVQEMCRDHAEYEERTVAILRQAGASYSDIGEALGISKQAAWERFA